MTFRENLSDVKLANRSLSRLSAGIITAIDPPAPTGSASREAFRWYKATVARLLELHHWNLATARVTLTELTNDRTSEWLYKYQLPVDVAFPVSLATLNGTGGVSYYRGLAGLLGMIGGTPAFLKTGDVLYSRIAGSLDYVSYDITEADFNSTFANIVELSLAAAMCYGITKNRLREKELREQATSAINIAIAQNLNSGSPRYGDELTSRDVARGDFRLTANSAWWDYFPGIPA